MLRRPSSQRSRVDSNEGTAVAIKRTATCRRPTVGDGTAVLLPLVGGIAAVEEVRQAEAGNAVPDPAARARACGSIS